MIQKQKLISGKLSFIFTVVFFLIFEITAGEVTIDENLALLVDGEKFFPIAVCTVPSSTFPTLVELGINTLDNTGWADSTGSGYSWEKDLDILKFLNEADSSGLKVILYDWMNENYKMDKYINHPALLCWTHWDEPDHKKVNMPIKDLRWKYEDLKKHDPNHPVHTCFIGNYVINYPERYDYIEAIKYTDIISFDKYFAMRGNPQDMHDIGIIVDTLETWIDYKKPIWAWIEAVHDYRGTGRGPEPYETKYQVWASIVHGAKGIFYWAVTWKEEFDDENLYFSVKPEMRKILKEVNQQITQLTEVILSPDFDEQYVNLNYSSDGWISWLTKKWEGNIYLFVVNEKRKKEEVIFRLINKNSELNSVEVMFEQRNIDMKNNSFSDSFGELGVHIYKLNINEFTLKRD